MAGGDAAGMHGNSAARVFGAVGDSGSSGSVFGVAGWAGGCLQKVPITHMGGRVAESTESRRDRTPLP